MRALVPLCLLVAALGCADSHVKELRDELGWARLSRPEVALVYDFHATSMDVSLDRPRRRKASATSAEAQMAVAASAVLSEAVVHGLRQRGIQAERTSVLPSKDRSVLLVRGQFLKIDEGSRAMRTILGFAAGASEVVTITQLYTNGDGDRRAIQEFQTRSTGQRTPGVAVPIAAAAIAGKAIAATAAISGGSNLIAESLGNVEGDILRTADQVADIVARLYIGQGWMLPPTEEAVSAER